jgi:hypothetical protein
MPQSRFCQLERVRGVPFPRSPLSFLAVAVLGFAIKTFYISHQTGVKHDVSLTNALSAISAGVSNGCTFHRGLRMVPRPGYHSERAASDQDEDTNRPPLLNIPEKVI